MSTDYNEPIPCQSPTVIQGSGQEPITEEWLASVGFKWHQLERQPEKHWLLWLGDSLGDRGGSYDDLGIELSATHRWRSDGFFHCWLRADYAGRYSRFLHVRHLQVQGELIQLIEGLTGQQWNPENNLYGSMRTPKQAEYLRREHNRLDRRIMRERPWRPEIESDDTMGGALPEHLEAAVKDSKTEKE